MALHDSLFGAGKLRRQWPAALWEPLQLKPVAAVPVSPSARGSQPQVAVRLQTNDEALVENRAVASLVSAKDMRPDLYAPVFALPNATCTA